MLLLKFPKIYAVVHSAQKPPKFTTVYAVVHSAQKPPKFPTVYAEVHSAQKPPFFPTVYTNSNSIECGLASLDHNERTFVRQLSAQVFKVQFFPYHICNKV